MGQEVQKRLIEAASIMFVPRTLRLKGLREQRQSHITEAPLTPQLEKTSRGNEKDQSSAKHWISQDIPDLVALHNTIFQNVIPEDQSFSKNDSPRFAAQITAGVELIFTDYAHQESERAKWLKDRYRSVDNLDNFVHFAAILQHPNIVSLQPEVSQLHVQRALRDCPSTMLEVSRNGYYVRRTPSSYPARFVPENSFEVVDDDGLTFWDQRTIYVEPHLRAPCLTPARIAHYLQHDGQMRRKWFPIQAVHMLWDSCAFVVLSGNVMHDDIWTEWRKHQRPKNWKVMTKVEHTKQTAECVSLLEQQNHREMRRVKGNISTLPALEQPTALTINQLPPRKKRKRVKPKKAGKQSHEAKDVIYD